MPSKFDFHEMKLLFHIFYIYRFCRLNQTLNESNMKITECHERVPVILKPNITAKKEIKITYTFMKLS